MTGSCRPAIQVPSGQDWRVPVERDRDQAVSRGQALHQRLRRSRRAVPADDGRRRQARLPGCILDQGVLRLLETVEQRSEVSGRVIHASPATTGAPPSRQSGRSRKTRLPTRTTSGGGDHHEGGEAGAVQMTDPGDDCHCSRAGQQYIRWPTYRLSGHDGIGRCKGGS